SDNESWWSKGHGTLVDDAQGNWWLVYHAYANGFHTLGRQTLIEPVEWTKDGWFKSKNTASADVNHDLSLPCANLSDDFSSAALGLQWTFWKEYVLQAVTIKENSLSLKAKGTTPADARLLLVIAQDKNYEAQVEITVEKGNRAGLVLFYNEKAFAGLVVGEENFTIYKDAENKYEFPNKSGNHLYLKIINHNNHCSFQCSGDGQIWETLVENVDVSAMHHNNYKGFFALRIGLLSAEKGSATFKDFRYKNVVPQKNK
ncbi:MAG: family 43 glycosylhydrolase, partial [Dysgonamonadaceae bacterium]|nr:family 43 glycosylhydrolase [Dysgonamonadaceae bacterium]